MCPWTSTNGRPWPDRPSRASSRSTTSSELEELADRVGRPAVVVEQRDPAEHVVAGDQDPVLGLKQADVRRGVPGGLVRPPDAEVGLDLDAVDERPVGLDHLRDPRRQVLGEALGVALEDALGHSALAADLEPASERGLRVACGLGRVPWLGCIQNSHPARATIGAACPQWSECAWVTASSRTCSSRRLTWLIARSSWASDPGSWIPGVHQHDA